MNLTMTSIENTKENLMNSKNNSLFFRRGSGNEFSNLIAPILLTSNYFGDGRPSETSRTTSKPSVTKVEEEFSDKQDSVQERKLSWAWSHSESSDEENTKTETEGTFYFLDSRRVKNDIIVSDSSKSPEHRNRTHSVENMKPTLVDKSLLISTIKERQEVDWFGKPIWRNIYWIITVFNVV